MNFRFFLVKHSSPKIYCSKIICSKVQQIIFSVHSIIHELKDEIHSKVMFLTLRQALNITIHQGPNSNLLKQQYNIKKFNFPTFHKEF